MGRWEHHNGLKSWEDMQVNYLQQRSCQKQAFQKRYYRKILLRTNKDGSDIGFIQVKSCHPDISASFILNEIHEQWINAPDNQVAVFVWFGSSKKNESPRYLDCFKKEVAKACVKHGAHRTKYWERRFYPTDLNQQWENDWKIFVKYMF